MLKKLCAAMMAVAVSATAMASEYYVVVPMPGKPSPDGIAVDLSPYSLPLGKTGRQYNFDLNSVLQVSGDAQYDPSQVIWANIRGGLPSGIALGTSGVLSGTPLASNGAGQSFEILANYKGVTDQQRYTLKVEDPLPGIELSAIPGGYAALSGAYGNVSIATSGVPKNIYIRNSANDGAINADLRLDSPSGKFVISKVWRVNQAGAIEAEVCASGGNVRTGCQSASALGGTGAKHLLVQATFIPRSEGVDTATLTVTDPSLPAPLTLALEGKGVVIPAQIAVSDLPGSTTGPSGNYGDVSSSGNVTKTFFLRNVGTEGQIRGDLTLTSAQGGFSIVGVNKVAQGGWWAGATCTSGGNTRPGCEAQDRAQEYHHLAVQVKFQPSQLGAHSATLSFAQAGSTTPTVLNLSANSVEIQPALTAEIPPDAGTVVVGQDKVLYVVLRNAGGQGRLVANGSLSSPSGAFTIMTAYKMDNWGGSGGGMCSGVNTTTLSNCVAQDGSLTYRHMVVMVKFRPLQAGAHTATLTLDHNGTGLADPLVVQLSGTGQ